jgi:ABC-type phosphate transport system substrate-binding protein
MRMVPGRRAPAGRALRGACGHAIAILALVLPTAMPAVAADPGFKIILNANVAGRTVSKQTLADIYLGRIKRWADGRPITAVDLPSTSPVRTAFSRTILDMSVAGVKAHWMQLLPTGERPPLSRPNDDAVIEFVATRAGAVGYVSDAATLPDTVKVVSVQ